MLTERGELNQTKLLSYCGLNLTKHREILEELERKNLIEKTVLPWGNKTITKYKISHKGLDFCKLILNPYENMFPRIKEANEEEEEKNNVN